ncbi:MAG: exodeoxyribonuclease V subunit gamma [Clostridia bacterium]|nr:exodeoxyribonuclease V subunit gamma [Clostridia bacterium]
MGLRIIYGRAGTGKSSYCFSEISNIINNEKKIFVITPEQFSFTAEKKLMEICGKKAVINVEVITLSRMAYRVLNEIGGNSKKSLSKCGKSMIIYSILNAHKKDFKFLGKSDENIDLAMRAVTEFKKHGITYEDLDNEIENLNDEYLKTKLNDINLVFKEFEKRIEDSYIEETDLLNLLLNAIEESNLVKESVIYIDEFQGFTYQEYKIIAKLVKLAKQVTITMCTDNMVLNFEPDTDVFYSNKLTLEKLVKLTKDYNLKQEKSVELLKKYRFKNEELIHLEENLYDIKSTMFEQTVDNIHLFLAKNQYSEIENIAKNIHSLVKNEGLRYRDISVITKNIDTYSSLIRTIFKKYKIPVFIDEKRDLNQNIIVQYFLALIEVIFKNFSNEALFGYIKSGFLDFDEDDIFKLENYCNKWGIKQNKWKKDFTYDVENFKEEVEKLNVIRAEIINPLIELKSKIIKQRTAKNISYLMYEFMENNCIEEKFTRKIVELQENGLIDLANEYVESYKNIISILDEMVTIFGDEKITLDNYYQIFKVGLKNSELGKIPGTQDQVIIGDVDRSRSHKVNTVFIIGLNDGAFPSVNTAQGFLNDKDREILKQDNLELAKGTIENLYEENFNIYKAFTTAEERLYLSYASQDSEGKSLRASMIVIKLKKMFPKLIEDSDILKNNVDDDNLYNFNPKINIESIEKLYGTKLMTSVSKLEQYRKCPFSYYLQYGLRLKEKEELKIQSINTGSFMHEVIDTFFERTHEENISLPYFLEDENKIKKMIDEIVENKLGLSRNAIFTTTAKYRILVERLKRILAKALKYIIEGLVYSDFELEGTEVEFKPILMKLDNGKEVEIKGKIDRLDIAKTEEGNYVRIIDYKSSAKNIDLNEVYAGLQIQLLTYMDAMCTQEDLMPAGVLYFNLLEQMVKEKTRIDEIEIEDKIRKSFKMKGLIIADIQIIKMHDKTLDAGSSKYVPAAITKSQGINKKDTNGVSKEEFKKLQEYVLETIKEIAQEILEGKIDIKPHKYKGKTQCTYCPYHSICGFNPNFQ